jgi:hypothetical protein
MKDSSKTDRYKTGTATTRQFRQEIPYIVDELVTTCNREDCFDHVEPEPISPKEALIEIEGADQLRYKKRHPTIEEDVIIYSGATILGGQTVIGGRSVIGGNVWIIESIPPDTTVYLKKPELIFKEKPNSRTTYR